MKIGNYFFSNWEKSLLNPIGKGAEIRPLRTPKKIPDTMMRNDPAKVTQIRATVQVGLPSNHWYRIHLLWPVTDVPGHSVLSHIGIPQLSRELAGEQDNSSIKVFETIHRQILRQLTDTL